MGSALVGVCGVAAVVAALVPLRVEATRTTPALALVMVVVAVALLGGASGAVVTAFVAAVAFNLAFIPPYWTFEVDVVEDIVALAVFTAVAVVVGTLVAREARQRRAAEEHGAELQTLNDRFATVAAERERLAAEATRLAVLEQVDEARAALLRSVSHDLRTPLSTIRAVTSDLRAGAEYDDETRDELLDLVVDEAERLDRIVANLLSMSRIEAGAFQPRRQAVALDDLIGASVARLASVLRHQKVSVDVPDGLPLADADFSQLDQVVSNLLENAARHSPVPSTISVGASAQNGMLAVAVEDEGPGVPPADRALVFQPFWHGSGASTSGLGLSICLAIVSAHGGAIRVEDGAVGARFVFTVPAHDAGHDAGRRGE